jgi:hypothetical protein
MTNAEPELHLNAFLHGCGDVINSIHPKVPEENP